MKIDKNQLEKKLKAYGLNYKTGHNASQRCFEIVFEHGIVIEWEPSTESILFLGLEPLRSEVEKFFTEPLVTKEGVDAAELKSLQMAYANAQAVVEYLKAQIENKGVA